jgi:hypothetical protein
VLFAVYQYLRRTAGPARWADSRRSYHLQKLREHLHAAASEPEHARYWRPIILALSDDSRTRGQILRFSSWLEGGSGLTTLLKVIEGEGAKIFKLKAEAEAELSKDINAQGVNAFSLVLTASNLQAGIHALIQTFGIGPIHANIMILNWHDPVSSGIMGLNKFKYTRNLREAFRLGCNVIMLDSKEKEWPSLESLPSRERRIDVWWVGDATSRLMLLLAYLMTRNEEWDGAQIRVLAVEKEIQPDEFVDNLRKTIEETRIDAEPEVLNDLNPDVIVETSLNTTISFFPFRLKGGHLDHHFEGDLEAFLSRLPITALVLAAEDIDLDAEPEEGRAGEMAAALDILADAQKKARDAEKEASKADEKLREMQDALTSEADEAFTSRVRSILEAKDNAVKAARRAAKALAKFEEAERTAEALGRKPEKTGENERETKT